MTTPQGLFMVDLTGLKLSDGQLKDIEKEISAVVQRHVAALHLAHAPIVHPAPGWQGLVLAPVIKTHA